MRDDVARWVVVAGAVVAVCAGSAVLVGQERPGGDTRKAEEVYKNIQVLRGAPAGEINQSMHLMQAQTGMDCTYCHVEGQFDRDDKPAKATARRMIVMMDTINRANFGGRRVVTCYTCHNGRPTPKTTPVDLPVPLPVAADPPPSAPVVVLPAVDQVLARYVEALGGEAALRAVTSRVLTGSQFIPTGPGGRVPVPAQVERIQRAPNLLVTRYRTPTGTQADGFDGSRAWTQNAQGRVADAVALDQARTRREADLQWPLRLTQLYATLEVSGTATVNGHDAWLVTATPQGDLPERLYFDVVTGLLLRRDTALPTPIGDSLFRTDYADYRRTNAGVQVPFTITMSPASARSVLYTSATLRVTAVQDNVPVEPGSLARPGATP